MKTIIALLPVACGVILAGCHGADNDLSPGKTYRIYVIEGCEYLLVSRRPWAGDFAMTHKGNCTNHIYQP